MMMRFKILILMRNRTGMIKLVIIMVKMMMMKMLRFSLPPEVCFKMKRI